MDNNQRNIVFLHGALHTSQDLDPLIELLRGKGFKTFTFNFSGHGKSAVTPEEFRIDLFARDLDTYLKHHSLTDVAVFGHSLGGYVALYHKTQYDDSPISTLFTYGTKFNWSASCVAKELPMLDPEHLLSKFPQYAEVLIEKHGDQWKHLLRSTAHMLQNLERLDGLTREDLSDVEIPVILMLGDQDRMVTKEETQLTASWLSKSQVKTISHSKHEIERSNISEIAKVIEENAF